VISVATAPSKQPCHHQRVYRGSASKR